ncbi:hypothetical protein [Maritalea mediterranea]|uniref:Uncharacterized protein n=1 Tax=Maritalea mediterranea TaxID=2909667 RepID=A0ABS9E5Z5_9HYPH|nr:hypothetical protein [Maritalea mediterranea]MCF4098203.1 hypothetical protein [Maritalea mediterranea]
MSAAANESEKESLPSQPTLEGFDPENQPVVEILKYVLGADAIIDQECIRLLEVAKARLRRRGPYI